MGSLYAIATLDAPKKESGFLSVGLMTLGLVLWFGVEAATGLKDPATKPTLFFAPGYFFVGVGSLLLLAGALAAPARLIPRALVYLGKISYGLYVFHMLVVYLVQKLPFLPLQHKFTVVTAISLASDIAVASLSYRFLEKPFLRRKQKFELIQSRPA